MERWLKNFISKCSVIVQEKGEFIPPGWYTYTDEKVYISFSESCGNYSVEIAPKPVLFTNEYTFALDVQNDKIFQFKIEEKEFRKLYNHIMSIGT